jgi:hypothetical protein|tara:strand:+ start:916 stop:1425 length:510 start_codon:yes stop_codon:yes gene_type:complete
MLTSANACVGAPALSARARVFGQDARVTGARSFFPASRSSQNNRTRRCATTVVAGWVLKNSGPNTTEHLGDEEEVVVTPSDLRLTEPRMVVGRQASDSVSLEVSVPTVSGAHAMIETTESKVMVTDLSSTNGTFIDGEELTPGTAYPLLEGGEVIFGDEFVALYVLTKQ